MSTTVVMQDPTTTPSDVSDTHLKSPNQKANTSDLLPTNKDILAEVASSSSSSILPSNRQLSSRRRAVSVSTSRLHASPSEQIFGGELRRSETISGHMTRKRPAKDIDLGKKQVEEQETEDPAGENIDSARSLANHICLCQPAPKIPRPRNGKPLISLM
jgi:hypothetical protein